jgi:hypothetical protein
MYQPQSRSSATRPSKSPLFPSPPLESFRTFIESHGVFNPIVSNQTSALHYFSHVPACGFQTLKDQFDVHGVLIHIILYHANAPTPRKVVKFCSHKTISHLLFYWLMHEPIVLIVLPWNPHALNTTQLSFLLNNNQMFG